jgi:nonribosomal peptide synthetase protein BlmX
VTGPVRDLDLVLAPVDAWSGRPAVSDPEGTLTYRELFASAAALAASLRALGVRAGEPVVVHTRLSRWAVAAMLGVLRAGAQYVPVDQAFPQGRRAAVVAAARARFAVVEPDPPYPVEHGAFEEVIPVPASGGSSGGQVITGELPAYTLFTSGSAGTPKGVVVSRRALAYSTLARTRYYPEPPSTFLLCSSISFDSSVAGIYWSLVTGAHLVIPSAHPADVVAVAEAGEHHRASHLLLLPSLYRILLDAALGPLLRTVGTVIVAGEVCPPALVRLHHEMMPETVLYNEYGPTECAVWSLVHRCVAADGQRDDVPIGRPIPGTTTHVRSGDRAVADSEVGELWISGPGVASGYVTGDDSAFGTIDGTRAYRTGDLVRVDRSGDTHYVGRVDQQVKLSGVRVELGEIEQLVGAYSQARAVAVGVVREDGEPRHLVAFVVEPGEGFRPELVTRRIRDHLPRAAVPNMICPVPALPVLPNGKVDRRLVDELAVDRVRAGSRR